MREDYLFDAQLTAQNVLKELRKIACDYGVATVADYKDIIGLSGAYMYSDNNMGWTYEMLRKAHIISLGNDRDWTIKFPCEVNLSILKNHKEENTMAITTNKSYDANTSCYYNATPEELELEKAIKEAQDEAQKKIMDIRMELSKTLTALRSKYQEQEAVKREEQQAHAWKRKYDALLKEGFSVEQAWEMTMEAFKID